MFEPAIHKPKHRRTQTQLHLKDFSKKELELTSQSKKDLNVDTMSTFKQKYEILNMKYEGFKTQLADILH